jgi:hypothetical protein
MEPIIELIEKLTSRNWTESIAYNGDFEQVIKKISSQFHFNFPLDYLEMLKQFNGGEVFGFKSKIHLFPLEELEGMNYDERFDEDLPGMFVIGDDGGGGIYFYDKSDYFKKGINTVWLVRLSMLGFDDSFKVGENLTDVYQKIIANISLRQLRPK